jgi:TonB family protein
LTARAAIARMAELSSPVAVIDVAAGTARVCRWPSMMCRVLPALVVAFVSVSSLHAQSATPVKQAPPPRAIYTPKPVYRAEWAKQGLAGKGVVLVTIDRQTGRVTGARMLMSTGNQQLDGAALQAYSQWRFDPRTVAVSQLKIPIEFAKRPAPGPPTAKRSLPQPVILLIVLAIAGAGIGFLRRRRA